MDTEKKQVFQLSAYHVLDKESLQLWFTAETSGTFHDAMFSPMLKEVVQLYYDSLKKLGKSSAEIDFDIQFQLNMALLECEKRGETNEPIRKKC